MAHSTQSQWALYHQLRDLICEALDEIEAPDEWETPVTICISPSLDEVYATFEPWWEDERLADIVGTDWNIETASDEEEALELANNYVDLRQ